jgi:hypothetical protein
MFTPLYVLPKSVRAYLLCFCILGKKVRLYFILLSIHLQSKLPRRPLPELLSQIKSPYKAFLLGLF